MKSTTNKPSARTTEDTASAVASEKNEPTPVSASAAVGPPTNSSNEALTGSASEGTVRSKALTSPQSEPSPLLKYTCTIICGVVVVDVDDVEEVVVEALVVVVEVVVVEVVAIVDSVVVDVTAPSSLPLPQLEAASTSKATIAMTTL